MFQLLVRVSVVGHFRVISSCSIGLPALDSASKMLALEDGPVAAAYFLCVCQLYRVNNFGGTRTVVSREKKIGSHSHVYQ